jgi:hypothetical protein
MSKLVHNERTKMIATHLNNLSVASVVAGIIIPALQGINFLDGWKWAPPLIVGLILQACFMYCSNWVLLSLEE